MTQAEAPTPKRVLSLATLFPNATQPRLGTFVARSLEALAAGGDWQVTVINPIGVPPLALGRYRARAEAAVSGQERGLMVHRPTFPLIPKLGGRANPALIASSIMPLIHRLHASTPFALVDAQFFYPDGPAAARIAAALGLPLSIKARGGDIHYWGAQPYAAKAMLRAARQASGLLAVSEALAEDMAALGMNRDKITIHYTGLDRDRFRPLGHPLLRRRLGEQLGIALPERAPLLAGVGALIPRKGHDLTIAALTQLPDAQLLIVGEGEEHKRLEALAARLGVRERVHLLGAVDHDLLPVILSAADAMVLPSASEGIANAWIEALACGTPLVICDAGGAREIVDRPEAGVVVARDPAAIAAGITEVLARNPPPDAVAATVEGFSWQANAAALAAYYERLIGG